MAKFKLGQSGNPKGRPPGRGRVAKLRDAIEKDLPEVIQTVVGAAKAGDMTAAKLLLDRVVPALKPVDGSLEGLQGKTLSERGESALEALATGTLTPEQADRVMSAVSRHARVIEIDDLVRRVGVLEGAAGAS